MKKILFVCAENANRSQMAEAFFNFYAKKEKIDFIAESAGTFPSETIHSKTIKVMSEKNISLQKNYPKKLKFKDIGQYEKIISFGCLSANAFEQTLQKRIIQWQVDDSSQGTIADVRISRDIIKEKVITLVHELKNSDR